MPPKAMEEEKKTNGILRNASIIRPKTIKETLAKRVAIHTSEVIYAMECTDPNCPSHKGGKKLSDFGFAFLFNHKSRTEGVLSFNSTWWCCDPFMCEVEAACLFTFYQYFSVDEVEIIPDDFYQ